MEKIFIIIDGASSGNGISAGVGIVLKNEKGDLIHQEGKHIGKKTNNEAEYEAVIFGMQTAMSLRYKEIIILTDSNTVFNQITGGFQIKGANLRTLFQKVEVLKKSFKKFDIDFVPKEYTHEADLFAREASESGAEKEVEKKYPFLTYKK